MLNRKFIIKKELIIKGSIHFINIIILLNTMLMFSGRLINNYVVSFFSCLICLLLLNTKHIKINIPKVFGVESHRLIYIPIVVILLLIMCLDLFLFIR